MLRRFIDSRHSSRLFIIIFVVAVFTCGSLAQLPDQSEGSEDDPQDGAKSQGQMEEIAKGNQIRDKLQDDIAKEVEQLLKNSVNSDKTNDELGKDWDSFYQKQAHNWADFGSNWAHFGDKKQDPKQYMQGQQGQFGQYYKPMSFAEQVQEEVEKEVQKQAQEEWEKYQAEQAQKQRDKEEEEKRKQITQHYIDQYAKQYMGGVGSNNSSDWHQYLDKYMEQYAKPYTDKYAKQYMGGGGDDSAATSNSSDWHKYSDKYIDQYAKPYTEKYAKQYMGGGDDGSATTSNSSDWHQYSDKYMDKYVKPYTDKYAKQYMGGPVSMASTEQSDSNDSSQDWHQYMEKYAKSYMDQYAQKYMDQYAQKYMNQYAQKYMDQYASKYMNGGQGSSNDSSGSTSDYHQYFDKYVDKYAKPYMEKYMDGGKSSTDSQSSFDNKSIGDQLSQIMDQQTKESSSSPASQVLTVNIDLKSNLITLKGNELAANGKPMEEWNLNRETGDVTITTRSKDGSEVNVKNDVIKGHQEVSKTDKSGGQNVDWMEDPEKQRSVAFNLMYFFIVFIIITLTMLYIFQKNLDAQVQRKLLKKGMEGTYPSYNQGQHFSMTHDLKKQEQQTAGGHRVNNGFGSNNLAHLSQPARGRFDDIEVDNELKISFADHLARDKNEY